MYMLLLLSAILLVEMFCSILFERKKHVYDPQMCVITRRQKNALK